MRYDGIQTKLSIIYLFLETQFPMFFQYLEKFLLIHNHLAFMTANILTYTE